MSANIPGISHKTYTEKSNPSHELQVGCGSTGSNYLALFPLAWSAHIVSVFAQSQPRS